MLPPRALEALLLEAFPDARLELVDLTGTQDHYELRIAAQAFAGKGRVEQHRLVYAALGEAMHGPVHALALKTFTPEAWDRATA